MNIDPKEAESAAKLSAACDHVPHEHGCCLYCGALQGDNGHWEPPVRRTPLFVTGSFDSRSVTRALLSAKQETLDGLLGFATKLEELIDAHGVPGYAGVLMGVGAGIFVSSGASDEQVHQALDASIAAARGSLKLCQGNA